MLEQLNKIDTGPADALKALREEREVLEGRVKAMDDMKSDVAEAVYLRVRADYVSKINQLNEQSRPLLDDARKQYAELKAIMSKLEAEAEAINLDRQEIELRHKLGEFDAKEYGKRVKAIEEALGEKGQWVARGTELKERFLLAVTAEAELEAAAPKPKPQPPAPAPAPKPAPAAPTPAPTAPHITNPQLEAVTLPPSQTLEISQSALPNFKAQHLGEITNEISPPPPNATMMMPAVKAPAAAPPPPAAAQPMAPQPIVSESTVMFRPARLVPQNPEAGKATHALGLKPMLVGSDSANDIRVGGPGIEPRHAQIAPTAGGYVLTDFETKHGTRVNAEKVKERVLANEDVIQIGAARFVFRQ